MPTAAASLVQIAMNAVTGVGEPTYTSGTQPWNGTAPILKSRPTLTSVSPVNSSHEDCAFCWIAMSM